VSKIIVRFMRAWVLVVGVLIRRLRSEARILTEIFRTEKKMAGLAWEYWNIAQ